MTHAAEVTVAPAMFTPLDKQGNPDPSGRLEVHFNPASLQLQLSNTLEQKGGKTTEHVTTSSAKLTMDLVFDSTGTLTDVRLATKKLVNMLAPRGGKTKKFVGEVRPVLFEWGTFTFEGIIESYKETLDFFSAGGVPLRAGVNLTLSHQEIKFEGVGEEPKKEEPVEAPADAGSGVSSVVQRADTSGEPDTGRAVAAGNGLESMRFPAGPLLVDPDVALEPPTAFAAGGAGIAAGAAAGAGFGAAAGAGFGAAAGAGFGAAAGAGFGASAGAGFGAGAAAGIGASARAGFGASAGAGIRMGAAGGAFAGAGAGAFTSGGAGAFAGAGASASGFASAGAGAFAGASAGVSGFAGAGASAGAGVGAFAGAGAGAGAIAGAGGFAGGGAFAGGTLAGGAVISPGEAPIFGGLASAGVPASLGAFAGLRAPLRRTRPAIDTSLLRPPRSTAMLATGGHASFDLTGRARVTGSASVAASVNGRSLVNEHVSFEEEW